MLKFMLKNAIYYKDLVRQNIIPILAILIAFWAITFLHIYGNCLGSTEPKNKTNCKFSYISLLLCFFSFVFIVISFLFDTSLGINLKMLGVALFIISVINLLGLKPISDYIIKRRCKQSY